MANRTVNVLSLCSGAGGLDLGVRLAIPNARTVCYVEIEAYAAEVLACRMEETRLDAAPLWTDLRTFDGRPWRGVVDLVVGGYPCQPFSVAGARRGADDPRHLWPHIARILRELGKPDAFFENVSGHVSLGLREVRSELEGMGYRVEAELVRAEEVGAPHRRERVFILAYTDQGRSGVGLADPHRERVGDADQLRRRTGTDGSRTADAGRGGALLADADNSRLEGWRLCGGERADERTTGPTSGPLLGVALGDPNGQGQRQHRGEFADIGGWPRGTGEAIWPPRPDDWSAWQDWNGPQPAICRNADGLANRVDELRLCGGGVVPQQAAYAIELLIERIRRAA